jgi:hypothetical protein
MAEKHPAADDEPRGTMDISDNVRTWLGFWAATKWSAIALAVLGLLLLFFRTNDGV